MCDAISHISTCPKHARPFQHARRRRPRSFALLGARVLGLGGMHHLGIETTRALSLVVSHGETARYLGEASASLLKSFNNL